MNTKKRILAVLLGFIIFTNVTFNSYRNTYAVAVVDDAVGIGIVLMLLAACGLNLSVLSSSEAKQLAGDFIDYLASSNLAEDQQLYAEIIDVSNLYRSGGSGGSNPDPNKIKAVFKLTSFAILAKKAFDFFSNKFNSDSGVVEYPFVFSGVSNAMVNSMDDYWSYVDPIFMGVFNTDNVTWGYNRFRNTCQADRRYLSIYRAVHNVSGEIYFAVLKSNTGYGVEGFVGNDRYFVSISSANSVAQVSTDVNYFADYSLSLLGTCYYDTSLSDSSVDAGTSISNKDIGLNPVNPLSLGLDNFVSKLSDKFKLNDLTDEPETNLDPNNVLDRLAAGEPLDDVMPDIKQENTLDPFISPSNDPYENPDPEANPNLQPAADAQPITGPVTISNTGDIANSIAQTYGKGNIDFNKFKINKNLSTTFPFSLPWDIMRILKIFQADPVAPVFEFDFSGYFPFNLVPAEYKSNLVFRLDLSDFDTIIKVEKFFITMGYALFLITVTRSKMIRG